MLEHGHMQPTATRGRDWIELTSDHLNRLERELRTALRDPAVPKAVQEAAWHLVGAGGKRIRPALVFLGARAGGLAMDDPRLVHVASAAELLHTASLLHDDVMDEAATRRGRPASRILWGNEIAVLAGDFCLARALAQVTRTRSLEVLESLDTVVAGMVGAQALEIEQRRKPRLDEEHYLRIVEGKTALLMAWCAQAGGLVAEMPGERLFEFGKSLGVAFQIQDDVLDYTQTVQVLGKPALQDLREGRLTLPLLLAARRDADVASAVSALFAEHPDGALPEDAVQNLAARVRESGGVDEAADRAKAWARRASRALEGLPDGPARRALDGLVRFCVERKS